ncbi:N-terminal phage replisome organiser (Phage_rep_org_N) [Faecalibacterium prausnitzii L2-6]|uniref:N-terminal phage replisome organiser (Phage_rep_org_N) n=1 Tax=Faecalibacterium prausnitzii L2-6 TaxID=718252 RepID=D4K4J3_9FIRM|nr:N-terminal phage replisome organiser (Phage_rep_org_N) [Faecalibacterium prausnitzii L2-6]
MADNRKYYYLKLKENFFDSDSIVLLEDMKDGILYSNILLKLYLKSLKNGGKLQLDEQKLERLKQLMKQRKESL